MSVTRLAISNLHKSFSVPVLTGVNVNIKAGEVHGLVGENGAGKSTLVNILSGILPYDSGTLHLDGSPYHPHRPSDAFKHGISLAAQELSLIETLSIAENISLRNLPQNKSFIQKAELMKKAEQLMSMIGLEKIDPEKPVGKISLGHRQLVELAKAMAFDSRLLILDEPTAALTELQAERLHQIIRKLANNGTSIIYISHRLEDVLAIANTVSVLRDGRVITSMEAQSLTVNDMIEHMSGEKNKALTKVTMDRSLPKEKPVLRVNKLTTRELPYPVSFDCHAGEIVGIAGLAGAGQTELLETFFGLSRIETGSVSRFIDDSWMEITSPHQAVNLGIGFLPEDRKTQGIFSRHSIKLNMTLPGLKIHAHNLGIINSMEENGAVSELIDKLSVKCIGIEQNIELLSGGNQQKVLVGRWLHNDSDILLLNEPTRGVDINTKYALHDLFRLLVEKGKTMVVVSSEIEELMSLCDRILVLSNRKQVKIFSSNEWDYNAILESAFSEYTINKNSLSH